ncbi:MAG TPA: VWA domain-containing protein [Bryobacteraceae bacterium]|nr:VWA domain-containing protein [Bryobacteraceae bacterium]
MSRFFVLTLVCGLLAAQQSSKKARQASEPPDEARPQDDLTFYGGIEEVNAPVWVFDRNGDYVNGLRPDQFRLFDNGREQSIRSVDVSYTPISLVICIQANSHVQGLLPQVNKIGNLISPLIIGDAGEAAVIAYDSRIRTLQDFTSDPDKITRAISTIYPGSTSNRMIDAVIEGTRLLKTRAKNRRRIMLLVGETRDLGSEARLREALYFLQINNVVFYSVDMSRFITTLTAPTPEPRPVTLPPAMYPIPSMVAATPTTVDQTYGLSGQRAEFVPLMVEIFKDVKAIFRDNPVEAFTKGTGGSEFGFHSTRTLQTAFEKIGEEVHSEYVITYTPSATTKLENGFHTIEVDVPNRSDVRKVLTRPGYWAAAHQDH